MHTRARTHTHTHPTHQERDQRFQRLRHDVEAQLQRGDASLVRPWHALAYPWSPHFLKRMSRSFADKTLRDVRLQGLSPLISAPHPPTAKRRLSIAYVSYCFSSHPTTYLLGSVFRLHDRERVHVHCYALNARDSSPARAAVERESVNMCEGEKIKWREERVKRGERGCGSWYCC